MRKTIFILLALLFAMPAYAADLVVYVRTDSTTGGDGTEDRTDGATRAFASLADMQANIASSYKDLTDSGGDTLTVYTSVGAGSAADTANVVLTGWTTSATNDLRIVQHANDKHGGTYNTSVYRHEISRSDGVSVSLIDPAYLTIDGLQFKQTATGGSGDMDIIHYHSTSITTGVQIIKNNIFVSVLGAYTPDYLGGVCFHNSSGSMDTYVYNNLFYGFNATGVAGGGMYLKAGDIWIYNNTFYDGVVATYNADSGTGDYTLINNLARGHTGAAAFHVPGGYNVASDYNSSDDTSAITLNATADTGSPWNNSADADADYLRNAAGDDYRPGAGDKSIDVGYDLSVTFTDDATGYTRDSSWDLGFSEWRPLVVYVRTDSTTGGDGTGDTTTGATRAFASLADMQANIAASYKNLTDAGGDVLIVYTSVGAGSVADSTAVTLSGWTTAPSQYLNIKQATADAHGGTYNTGVYRMELDSTTMVTASGVNHITIDGLQFYMTNVANGNRRAVHFSGGTDLDAVRIVKNSIFRGAGQAGADDYNFGLVFYVGDTTTLAGTAYIYNNLFYDWDETGGGLDTGAIELWDCDQANGLDVYVYNNTFFENDAAVLLGSDFGTDVDCTATLINNLARGHASAFKWSAAATEFDAKSDFNSSEDQDYGSLDINASKKSGSPWTSAADADTDYFADAASGDFRPAASDLQIDAGLSIDILFSTDAIAVSRGTGRTQLGTDNFNRTDADPLDGDWVTLAYATDDLALVTNRVLSSSSSQSGAYWGSAGGTPNQDAYVQATLTDGNNRFGLAARITDSASGDFYVAQFTDSTTGNIYKNVAGSWTKLGGDFSGSWSAGDAFRLEVSGTGANTGLHFFQDNTLIASRNDSAGAFTNGYCGLYSHASTQAGFDDFFCGSLTPKWDLGFTEYVAPAASTRRIMLIL